MEILDRVLDFFPRIDLTDRLGRFRSVPEDSYVEGRVRILKTHQKEKKKPPVYIILQAASFERPLAGDCVAVILELARAEKFLRHRN